MKRAFGFALIAIFAALLFSGGVLAQATNKPENQKRIVAVVELFTSQGCSSCPPADQLLKHYADRDDVIAISVPVNYWDYLGWKDTFASPRNTERQRKYAASRGDGAVYTPQMVVNGTRHLAGYNRRGIDKAIALAALNSSAIQVPLNVSVDNDVIEVDIGDAPVDVTAEAATVWLGMVQKTGQVSIRRGENSGRKLTYHNVVREYSPIGMWEGKSKKIQIPISAVEGSKYDSCVVLLQADGTGPIIGARWINR